MAFLPQNLTDIPNGCQAIFDYNGATDGVALYAGYAAPGVAQAQQNWTIYKFAVDANRQITQRTVAFKVAWSARTTSAYA